MRVLLDGIEMGRGKGICLGGRLREVIVEWIWKGWLGCWWIWIWICPEGMYGELWSFFSL